MVLADGRVVSPAGGLGAHVQAVAPGAEEAEDLGRLWRRLIVAIMVQLIKG